MGELQKNINTELWHLLDYAEDEDEGWRQITCAMEAGDGCMVKVIYKTRDKSGNWASSVALSFVPSSEISPLSDEDDFGNRDIITRKEPPT